MIDCIIIPIYISNISNNRVTVNHFKYIFNTNFNNYKMIDSIIISINNLHKYPQIIEKLDRSDKGEGKTFIEMDLDESYEGESEGVDFSTLTKYVRATEFTDHESKKKARIYSNKTHLKSSHYLLAYSINSVKNNVEFNFSIPKMLYGSNICQFVKHPNEKGDFSRSKQLDINYVMTATYDRLMKFVNKFIATFTDVTYSVGGEAIQTHRVNPQDVQIKRIDLCFNQYFDSKEDALTYLSAQKKIRKKYIRETSNNKTDWNTSIFLRTDDYTAKIYHKGSEYKSKTGELKHHKKINKQFSKAGKAPIFDTDFYQEESDKILRYEISFKNSIISRYYKNEVFRKDCKIHQSFKEISIKHRNFKDRNKRAWEKLHELETRFNLDHTNLPSTKTTEVKKVLAAYKQVKETAAKLKEFNEHTHRFTAPMEDGELFLYEYPYSKITKIYNSMISQVNEFVLDCDDYFKWYSNETLDLNIKKDEKIGLYKTTHFSEELFLVLCSTFRDFIDQFTLTEKISVNDLKHRAEQHNNQIKFSSVNRSMNQVNDFKIKTTHTKKDKLSKININALMKTVALLELYSLDEQIKLGLISRMAKSRILQKFKMLGFDHRALTSVKINTEISYVRYYDTIFTHGHKFRLKNGYFR